MDWATRFAQCMFTACPLTAKADGSWRTRRTCLCLLSLLSARRPPLASREEEILVPIMGLVGHIDAFLNNTLPTSSAASSIMTAED